jgi:ribokinase
VHPQLVVVGSLNADFVIRVARFPVPGETLVGREFNVFPGGKGANQAYAAARLGAQVSMIGQVGADVQADWLKTNLASAGVDVSQVHADAHLSSGVATITINGQGQNQIIIVPGANGTFDLDRLERSRGVIAAAGQVLLQLEIPLTTVVAAARMARQAGALVILDPAPAQELPDELLELADYLTPNETELAILTGAPSPSLSRSEAGKLARQLLARGARKIIVKMGAQGALLLSSHEEHFWPALPVKVIDTTAAGDAFNAAFATALARGQPELEAGRFATAAAACSVQRAGAQPSMPTHAEVEALLERRRG